MLQHPFSTLMLALTSTLWIAACAESDPEVGHEENIEEAEYAVGDPTGCGDPYYRCLGSRQVCEHNAEWLGVMIQQGWVEGCADCDQGTYCYPLYPN